MLKLHRTSSTGSGSIISTPSASSLVTIDIPPTTFGMPEKFSEWRRGQYDAVNFTLESSARFVGICAPTGWGKSFYYMIMSLMAGQRTGVLTSTKGLQDQLHSDFHEISADIRGMQNYKCPRWEYFDVPEYTTVAEAPCQCGVFCDRSRNGGCEYYDNYKAAQTADIFVTNYQCWMHDQAKQTGGLRGVRPVDILVLDEAHDAPEELAGYLSTELERRECLGLHVTWPEPGYSQMEWQTWAAYWQEELDRRIELLQVQIKSSESKSKEARTWMHEIKETRKLLRKISRVAAMKDQWVVQELSAGRDRDSGGARRGSGGSVRFDPLWPRLYAESALFRGVKKVVLVSATVRPKTAELLGISSEDLAFREYPSSFPVVSRPVIHVKTVQMNYRNEKDDSQMMWWLQKIDALLRARPDKRGIIHTVSYKRARFIYDNSAFKDRMMMHGSDDRAYKVAQFKKSAPGTVLLSPSVDTGYDFPYAECEFQIIGKIPFPSTQDVVLKERCRQDKEYSNYLTVQTLQQMTGRGMRAEDDRCETIIIDDNARWFVPANRHHFNKWWLEGYKSQSGMGLPAPLEKLPECSHGCTDEKGDALCPVHGIKARANANDVEGVHAFLDRLHKDRA